MGFNKRYFTTESIKRHAKSNTYESFKTYMLNPDAYMFDSEAAHKVWKSFEQADEEERIQMYNNIKHETWI
jgi:hypothetical protein